MCDPKGEAYFSGLRGSHVFHGNVKAGPWVSAGPNDPSSVSRVDDDFFHAHGSHTHARTNATRACPTQLFCFAHTAKERESVCVVLPACLTGWLCVLSLAGWLVG